MKTHTQNLRRKSAKWVLAAGMIAPAVLPLQVNAQQAEAKKEYHHYKLIDLGTLGGPNGQFSQPSVFNANSGVINDQGTSVGFSDTSVPDPYCVFNCFVNHAFVRKNSVTTDLGALPGGGASFATWINDRGGIAGQSENGLIDPLTGYPEFAAVLWKNGQIRNLGTLGGNQSNAYAINNRGQVVGGALTVSPDAFATTPVPGLLGAPSFGSFAQNFLFAPAATQTHAFLWQEGVMQDLGTLGGPDSAAELLNDRGQIAGVSFTSSTADASGVPTVDPFFWDDGKMVDVGSLGGTFGFPLWMNNRGQVVGQSNVEGDAIYHAFLWNKNEGLRDLGTFGGTFASATWVNDAGEVVGWANLPGDQEAHAFLWDDGVMRDLGTLGSDPCSVPSSINLRGQIVGSSGDCSNGRAFLWEDGGPMVDLNTLIPTGSGLTLTETVEINDRGEITVRGVLPSGDHHAILLIPCDEDHAELAGCDDRDDDIAAAAQSNSAVLPQTHPSVNQENTTASIRTVPNRAHITSRFRRYGTPQPSPK